MFSLFIATTYGDAAAPGAKLLKATDISGSSCGTRIPVHGCDMFVSDDQYTKIIGNRRGNKCRLLEPDRAALKSLFVALGIVRFWFLQSILPQLHNLKRFILVERGAINLSAEEPVFGAFGSMQAGYWWTESAQGPGVPPEDRLDPFVVATGHGAADPAWLDWQYFACC